MKIKLPDNIKKTIKNQDIEEYILEDNGKEIKGWTLFNSFTEFRFFNNDIEIGFYIDSDNIGELVGSFYILNERIMTTKLYTYQSKTGLKIAYKDCIKELLEKYKNFVKGFYEERKSG